MTDIIEEVYGPVLSQNGFIPDTDNRRYCSMGHCWKMDGSHGKGSYWIYSQKDLFDIKIHDFFFHEDSFLEFDFPKCLSITHYESVSGEEFSPYRRLKAGCIKTFIGGQDPYKVLIHKKIPIRSIGIEIMPTYYEDYLKRQYPGEYTNPQDAFRILDQTENFPEMVNLLHSVMNYRGEGIAAKLYYEGKVAQAVALVVEHQKKHLVCAKHLAESDIQQIENVTAYINDHYALSLPLERLAKIACMGTTKLKSSFRQFHGCTVTEYIHQRRMSQAEHLLLFTDLSIGQVAQTVGYQSASRFAELFRKSTGLLPGDYRKIVY